MPYKASISLDFGIRYAGLTNLNAVLVNVDGVEITSPIYLGFVEIGFGNYLWTYYSFPSNFRGGIKFKKGNDLLGFFAINPEELEYVDTPITTRCTGTGLTSSLFVNNIPSDKETIELRLTDDYFATEGRSIDISSDTWPSLDGSTNRFLVGGKVPFEKTPILINGNMLRIELSSQNLTTIGAGRWSYELRSTLSNTSNVTLTTGNLIIVPPFGD